MADRSGRARRKRLFTVLAVAAAVAMLATACTGGDDTGRGAGSQAAAGPEPDDTLDVYARDPDIARPLFKLFEQQTGIKVQAHWGIPTDLADEIISEGAGTQADVFYGPLSDALGTLNLAGRLTTLSDQQLNRVPAAYRSPDRTWVGTSGRAPAVWYNTDRLSEADLPDSILGFADPTWRGRLGWDPTSRSLLDVATQLRLLKGDTETRRWLEGIQANTPAAFRGAKPIIDAVAAGELIDVGFGSHSYLPDKQADGGARNVAAKFYRGGTPGGLLNLVGVGIIKGTDKPAAANAFVDFMLSPQAQQLEATTAFEIPVATGTTPPAGLGLPTADELIMPGLDQRKLEDLDSTRDLLRKAGITV